MAELLFFVRNKKHFYVLANATSFWGWGRPARRQRGNFGSHAGHRMEIAWVCTRGARRREINGIQADNL